MRTVLQVVWENVRALGDGETVSTTGTHLGHNLPDMKGNRWVLSVCLSVCLSTPHRTALCDVAISYQIE